MLRHGAVLNERDLGRQPLSVAEPEALFRGLDPLDFLDPRNELYRWMNMKEKPPTREEAIHLMAKEPNLIRRPLLVRGARRVAGYDADALEGLFH